MHLSLLLQIGPDEGIAVAVVVVGVLTIIAAATAAGSGHAARHYSGPTAAPSAVDRSHPRPVASSAVVGPVVPVRTVDFGSFPVARWLHDRGWWHDNGVYRGHFVARGVRLAGEVHYRNNEYELLLHRPPTWATTGSHSGCWRARPAGWKLLHLNEAPPNVAAAILGCEAFLLKKMEENAA